MIGQQYFDAAGQVINVGDIVFAVLPGNRKGLVAASIVSFGIKQCTVAMIVDGKVSNACKFRRYYTEVVKPGTYNPD